MKKDSTRCVALLAVLFLSNIGVTNGIDNTYDSAIIFMAESFHTHHRDYINIPTPFVFQGDSFNRGIVHVGGFSMYADHIYLRAYDITKDKKYLDWSVELVDWMWNNMVENDILADYNPIIDTKIHQSDVTAFVSFIGSNVELYLATKQPRFLYRAIRMTDTYWGKLANDPVKHMPFNSLYNTTNYAPIEGGFHTDFDKWHLPPLAAVARLTNSTLYKENL